MCHRTRHFLHGHASGPRGGRARRRRGGLVAVEHPDGRARLVQRPVHDRPGRSGRSPCPRWRRRAARDRSGCGRTPGRLALRRDTEALAVPGNGPEVLTAIAKRRLRGAHGRDRRRAPCRTDGSVSNAAGGLPQSASRIAESDSEVGTAPDRRAVQALLGAVVSRGSPADRQQAARPSAT